MTLFRVCISEESITFFVCSKLLYFSFLKHRTPDLFLGLHFFLSLTHCTFFTNLYINAYFSTINFIDGIHANSKFASRKQNARTDKHEYNFRLNFISALLYGILMEFDGLDVFLIEESTYQYSVVHVFL